MELNGTTEGIDSSIRYLEENNIKVEYLDEKKDNVKLKVGNN